MSESEVGAGEVKIRDATERDVEALANLMTELGYPSTVEEMGRRLARIYADPSYATLVVERDGLVVGMAGVHGVRYTIRKYSNADRRCHTMSRE